MTFHLLNDVTLLKLPDEVKQCDDTNLAQEPSQRTGEALISTFAIERPRHIANDVAIFVSLKPPTKDPDAELKEKKINAAVDLMMSDRSPEEPERLHEVLTPHNV